jgi:hypothetical protein
MTTCYAIISYGSIRYAGMSYGSMSTCYVLEREIESLREYEQVLRPTPLSMSRCYVLRHYPRAPQRRHLGARS